VTNTILIHQAADYYYGHRFGLIPPQNNHFILWTQRQIKIAAREISNEITLEVIRI
jgi:hypothetical protein